MSAELLSFTALSPLTGRRAAIVEKILARVEISIEIPVGLDTPCWLWTGPDSGTGRGGGYPRMSLDGATVAVHITMWVIENGPVPPRKQIDHRCTNRRCVNPGHLQMVTHRKNQRLRDERRAA
jgi:hypothetical protein